MRPRFTGTAGHFGLVAKDREAILDAFSLPILQLARVLHVERPTVYAWMNEDEPLLKADNRARLEAIADLADEWKRLGVGPAGSRARVPLTHGLSLVDLLKNEPLDVAAITQWMSAIAEHMRGKASPFQTRQAAEMREKLRRRGFSEHSEDAQQLNLEDQDRSDRYNS